MKQKKKRKESGQAIVEFALVLPLFLLLVMGIIDFGWLFYNYTTFENSARNAARIACVEYEDVGGYDSGSKTIKNISFTIGKDDDGAFVLPEGVETAEGNSDQEDILYSVIDTLPKSAKDVTVKITYSYDTKMATDTTHYDINDRYTGDVTVTVTGKIKVLTPVLGVTAENMEKKITARSTYKVEKQYTTASGS